MNRGTIFDIGMYDATDTVYYLTEGYRVIAIEANPNLVESAEKRLSDAVGSGQLVIVSGAIAEGYGTLELYLSGQDLGASSLIAKRADEPDAQHFQVKTLPIMDIIDRYGVPYYMKVDIEGFDRNCILPLSKDTAPEYVSFEMGEDAEELTQHLHGIGYKKFKIMNQVTLREFSQDRVYHHVIWGLRHRLLGPERPLYFWRAGRWFKSSHSSGPLPTKTAGQWHPFEEIIAQCKARQNLRKFGWWDLHARH